MLGLLLDPSELSHRLPSKHQIAQVQQEIVQQDGLRHMIVKRVVRIKHGFAELKETVSALTVAVTEISQSLKKEDL